MARFASIDNFGFAALRLNADRLQDSAARIQSIARIDVHVQPSQAVIAMVAAAAGMRLDTSTALDADESLVVLGEPCELHVREFNLAKVVEPRNAL